MPKTINLWEVDSSRMSTDPKERVATMAKMLEMTKKMLDAGEITDWGIFAGGGGGYVIGERPAAEVLKSTLGFAPHIKSHVYPVLSIDEVAEVMKSLR